MTIENGPAFNEWLRAQLRAKKMSQRQLAQQSGVDHSTISRLLRGDRMPSLGTATKLARGLRELHDDAETPHYLGVVNGNGSSNPTARVEYALRSDDFLSEAQVRQIMEYYLAVRARRYGRTPPDGGSGASRMEASGRPGVQGMRPMTQQARPAPGSRPINNGPRPMGSMQPLAGGRSMQPIEGSRGFSPAGGRPMSPPDGRPTAPPAPHMPPARPMGPTQQPIQLVRPTQPAGPAAVRAVPVLRGYARLERTGHREGD